MFFIVSAGPSRKRPLVPDYGQRFVSLTSGLAKVNCFRWQDKRREVQGTLRRLARVTPRDRGTVRVCCSFRGLELVGFEPLGMRMRDSVGGMMLDSSECNWGLFAVACTVAVVTIRCPMVLSIRAPTFNASWSVLNGIK